MAGASNQENEQVVPDKEEEDDVLSVQARYLRSPSPTSFSTISSAYTESIFMEPIHLSSAVAAKKIISEELKSKELKVEPMSPELLESPEQLLVEDLYNRVKDKIDDRSLFNTPCVMDLQRDLLKDHLDHPLNPVDEVWPNVFIAEKSVAVNKGRLKRMGITHILNAGHNTTVFTGPEFYTGMEIQYMGVEVDDFPECDISKFLRPAAEFLDEALLTYRGKVLVNSEMGMSRSAILVAAYLMIFHHMTILEALMTLRKKRAIYPNDGFIKQLRELNETLLEEREYGDDDDDNASQGSVIEAKAHSIVVEEEDVESVMGAKVHSITVEEEDTTSIMDGAMSTMGKASVISKQPTLIDEDEEERIYEEWRRKQGLPPREMEQKEASQGPKLPEEVDEDDLRQMIYNWQKETNKYQGLDLGDDLSSLMSERRYSPSEMSDVESVTSQEIRLLKQQLAANRKSRGRTDSESTASTWDMWNQRLLEIEKEAKSKAANGEKKRVKDIDEESLCSEAGSLFNFCKNNKHKLTPLERWKIKRIQFGYHKKDSEASETQNKDENGKKEDDETSKSDVDVTAYQAWKMKHQKKVGNENKDEIVEIAKGEDSAAVKRKQRRAEILERSKQNLEESQSICGWDNESTISGTIPLAALFGSVQSVSGAGDTASVLSMQSNRSKVSQARSSSCQAQIPIVAPPNLPPGAGDAISIAGIQNWIANVVNETIAQKQNEIMMMSRASSAMSMASGELGKRADDDRSSVLGGSCLSGSGIQQRDFRSTDSVLSCNSLSSGTNISAAKRKITQTSVPLYGLFMDDVDLKKLTEKENEMKEELTGKLSQYRKEKVVSDNKRSYIYKKKKAKENDEDEEKESISSARYQSSRLVSDKMSYLGNQFSSVNTTSSELERNINKWLKEVKTDGTETLKSEKNSRTSDYRRETDSRENSYVRKYSEQDGEAYSSYRDTHSSASRFSASSDEESNYVRRTKAYEPRHMREESPDLHFTDLSQKRNGLDDLDITSPRRSRTSQYDDLEDSSNADSFDLASKRRLTSISRKSEDEDENRGGLESQSSERRSSRHQANQQETEEMDDDDAAIAAWRIRQQETKARLRKFKDDD